MTLTLDPVGGEVGADVCYLVLRFRWFAGDKNIGNPLRPNLGLGGGVPILLSHEGGRTLS